MASRSPFVGPAADWSSALRAGEERGSCTGTEVPVNHRALAGRRAFDGVGQRVNWSRGEAEAARRGSPLNRAGVDDGGFQLLFAAFDALQIRLQQTPLGAAVPYQLFLMVPYVLSILALVLMSRRAELPAALMVPYNKGER